MEQTRAKAVFIRDLLALREKKQAAQQAAAPLQSQPPAPMIIDLDAAKLPQPSAPIAPMMAVSGASFPNRPAPKIENNPVAPFPDMGMGMGMGAPQPKPMVAHFGRAKPPVEHTRPSPKQPTPKTTPKPAPNSNPPSGRLANKPNPMKNAQKHAPKPPATAPPSASAIVPAPATPASIPAPAPATGPGPGPAPAPPPAPPAPVAAMSVPTAQPAPNMSSNLAPQSTFTNATFTVDPSNNDLLMQPSSNGQDLNLDMPMLDMDSFGNSGASGSGPAETANMDISAAQNSNSKDNDDSTMTDLDHFFDMGGDTSTSFDDNFNNMDDYINNDFTFDTFQ